MTDTVASEAGRALAARRKRSLKTCAFCGREFEGIGKARCCSPACSSSYYWQTHREELNKKRMERYRAQKATGEVPVG